MIWQSRCAQPSYPPFHFLEVRHREQELDFIPDRGDSCSHSGIYQGKCDWILQWDMRIHDSVNCRIIITDKLLKKQGNFVQ